MGLPLVIGGLLYLSYSFFPVYLETNFCNTQETQRLMADLVRDKNKKELSLAIKACQAKPGVRLLTHSFRYNDKEIIQLLLDKVSDINLADEAKTTLLSYAVSLNRNWIVEKLLDKGADPNLLDINGVSPLMMAVTHKDLELVDLLVKNGAKKNITDNFGMNPLMDASSLGYLDALKLMLADMGGEDDILQFNNQGLNSLTLAILNLRVEVVKYLLNYFPVDKKYWDKNLNPYEAAGLTQNPDLLNLTKKWQ